MRGHHAAWQYELSAGSDPDVDHDEALSLSSFALVPL